MSDTSEQSSNINAEGPEIDSGDQDKKDRTGKDDAVETEPATSGHSNADSQAQRNTEDESPS